MAACICRCHWLIAGRGGKLITNLHFLRTIIIFLKMFIIASIMILAYYFTFISSIVDSLVRISGAKAFNFAISFGCSHFSPISYIMS